MGKCSISTLCEKEVINTCDGRRLGNVCDALIDCECGRLLAIMVPPPGGFGLFGKGSPIVIPWEKICRLGEDIILVDIGPTPSAPPRPPKPKIKL